MYSSTIRNKIVPEPYMAPQCCGGLQTLNIDIEENSCFAIPAFSPRTALQNSYFLKAVTCRQGSRDLPRFEPRPNWLGSARRVLQRRPDTPKYGYSMFKGAANFWPVIHPSPPMTPRPSIQTPVTTKRRIDPYRKLLAANRYTGETGRCPSSSCKYLQTGGLEGLGAWVMAWSHWWQARGCPVTRCEQTTTIDWKYCIHGRASGL